MKNTIIKLIIFGISLTIILSACSNFNSNRGVANEISTNMSLHARGILDPSYTNSDIREYESPIIETMTMKITQTKHYTLTPIPTIKLVYAKTTIQKLLSPHEGCDFPCWWGIQSGETTWQSVKQYLSSLSCTFIFYNPNNFTYYNDVDTDVNISHHLADITCGEWTIGITIDDGVISWVEVPSETAILSTLNQALLWNTKPSKILVWTTSTTFYDSPAPFQLFLYYENEKALIYYELTARENGDYLETCPGEHAPIINIWSTIWNKKWEGDNIVLKRLGINIEYDRSIEEATNMDIETFIERIKGNIAKCIETPKELWS